MKQQKTHEPAISVNSLMKPFVDAGLIPQNANRLIIDLPAGGVVGLYYSVFADERFIDILPGLIQNLPVGQMIQEKIEPEIGSADRRTSGVTD